MMMQRACLSINAPCVAQWSAINMRRDGKRVDNSVRGQGNHLALLRSLSDVRISELATATHLSHASIRNNIYRILEGCKDEIMAYVDDQAAKYEQEQKNV